MPKSRKANTPKPARQPARKTARKSGTRTKPKPLSTNAASSRAPKGHSPAAPARVSKKAAIVALLERRDGAAIGDLLAATGRQAHTVRATLTGLRKDGKELIRTKDEAGVTRDRLSAAG